MQVPALLNGYAPCSAVSRRVLQRSGPAADPVDLVCSSPLANGTEEESIATEPDSLPEESALERCGRSFDRVELRRLLDGTCPPTEPPAPPSGPGVPAAVLIGLVGHPEGPSIILTQRTADLENHPAEISLPGGRVEVGDDGPGGAALREAFEEIGLPQERVEILGCLPPSETVSGFRVYPIVGWIEPPIVLMPDRREVAEVFEVPLRFVVDPSSHHRDSIVFRDERHHFHVIPYAGRRIWGATAGILVDFARALAS